MTNNDFCEKCLERATAFSVSTLGKVKLCYKHTPEMLEKALPVFPLEAFKFVNSAAEFPDFEFRKECKIRGQACLKRLIHSISLEKTALLQELASNHMTVSKTVARVYDSIQGKIETRYEETMVRLTQLMAEFQVLTESREVHLSPILEVIQNADDDFIPRLLKFTISNQSLEVAEAVMLGCRSAQESVDSALRVLDPGERISLVTKFSEEVQEVFGESQRERIMSAVRLSTEIVKMGVAGGPELYEKSLAFLKRSDLRTEFAISVLCSEDVKEVHADIADYHTEDLAGESDEVVLQLATHYSSEAGKKTLANEYLEAEPILLKLEQIITKRFPHSALEGSVFLNLAQLYKDLHVSELHSFYMAKFQTYRTESILQDGMILIEEAFFNIPPEYGSPGVGNFCDQDSLTFNLIGPDHTPYEGGVFTVSIRWHYVCSGFLGRIAKEVRFRTKIYHPNIQENSDVLSRVVKRRSESFLSNLKKVVVFLRDLLLNPCVERPEVREVVELFVKDKARFEAIAREWTERYAMEWRKFIDT